MSWPWTANGWLISCAESRRLGVGYGTRGTSQASSSNDGYQAGPCHTRQTSVKADSFLRKLDRQRLIYAKEGNYSLWWEPNYKKKRLLPSTRLWSPGNVIKKAGWSSWKSTFASQINMILMKTDGDVRHYTLDDRSQKDFYPWNAARSSSSFICLLLSFLVQGPPVQILSQTAPQPDKEASENIYKSARCRKKLCHWPTIGCWAHHSKFCRAEVGGEIFLIIFASQLKLLNLKA